MLNEVKSREARDKWFKVFRAGKYPQGDVSIKDVNEIASSYSRDYHEAPLTVLHEENSPAYAIVDKVKAENGVLLCTFAELLDPDVFEITRRFRKPSIEITLYDDHKYLRAVTLVNFPAVKALDPIKFAEENPNLYFTEGLSLQLFKDDFMFSEMVKKFAEKIGINVSDYQSQDELIAQAMRIVTDLQTKYSDATASIQSLNINLSKFSEAGIDVTKLSETKAKLISYDEMKAKVEKFEKYRVENLITFAIKTKNVLPASADELRKLAVNNFEAALKFVEALPDKTGSDTVQRFSGNGGQDVKYEDMMKDPSLAKNFTEEQIQELRKKSKLFA